MGLPKALYICLVSAISFTVSSLFLLCPVSAEMTENPVNSRVDLPPGFPYPDIGPGEGLVLPFDPSRDFGDEGSAEKPKGSPTESPTPAAKEQG